MSESADLGGDGVDGIQTVRTRIEIDEHAEELAEVDKHEPGYNAIARQVFVEPEHEQSEQGGQQGLDQFDGGIRFDFDIDLAEAAVDGVSDRRRLQVQIGDALQSLRHSNTQTGAGLDHFV